MSKFLISVMLFLASPSHAKTFCSQVIDNQKSSTQNGLDSKIDIAHFARTWRMHHETRVPPFSFDGMYARDLEHRLQYIQGFGAERFKRACREVRNLLISRDAWMDYVEKLITEAAHLGVKEGLNVSSWREKRIPREILLKVIASRFKSHNEPVFSTIPKAEKFLTNSEFAQFLRSGPFLDLQNPSVGGRYEHGTDIHVVQRDLVYKVIAKYYPKDPNYFYEILSHDIPIWDIIAESADKNGTSPEFLMHSLLYQVGFE